MGGLFSFLGGIKGIALIVLVLAVGGWVWNQKNNLDKAILERDTAIAQRDMVAVERDKAIAAARTNAETIARLEEDKRNVNEALNNLARARETNAQNTVTREVIIQNQATVPANASRAAPVLGAIVSEIQTDRDRRRAQ